MQNLKREFEGENVLKKPKLTNEERALNIIQEKDVGITKFVNNKGTGFTGFLKQRYSDFMVNEIDSQGNVVHLLDKGVDIGKSRKEKKLERRQRERQELHNKSSEEVIKIKEDRKRRMENEPKYELSEDNKKQLLELLNDKELSDIEQLFSNGGNTETTTTFSDKKLRGKLHQLLREAFQGKLDTVTSSENTIKIALAKNSSNPRRNPLESINHIDDQGVINYGAGVFKNYLHFIVYKENRETMEVASTISKFLRIASNKVRYAGTKDRRGVTVQKFSLHKGKVARVSSLNNGLKGVVLGGFKYEDTDLGLGDLKGNEFTITIRDARPLNEAAKLEDIIDAGFGSLQTDGFINYYGMQRFGTFSISTHTLGVRLLNEDWKGFVELLLSEQDVVIPESEEARKIWNETFNAGLALAKMPPRCTAEYSILKALDKELKNLENPYTSQEYFKSIMAIPRNLRIMYAHAYQSYIWNKVASKRIELFGLQVVEGDLIVYKNNDKKVMEDDGDLFEEDSAIDQYIRARPVTKEEVDEQTFSIFDVVLPMPGFDIVYPTNEELKRVYVEEMAKDGLDPFKMARRVREFSLAGSYRNLMSKPEGIDYKIIKYTDDIEPLVRTDLEVLNGQDRFITPQIPEGTTTKVAVILKLQLGVSSYATMALREFMKVDTARFSDSLNVVE